MIGSLRGKVLLKSPPEIIIEAGGVGYQLTVPTGTLSELPTLGHEAFLHVYTSVRDDAIQLFGFGTMEEKRVFIMLLGVSGIGPKVAMNVVSGIRQDELLRAIEAEDVALLSKVPGLGKKTASRLILELRGKLPRAETPVDAEYLDALSALENLGYRKAEARVCLDRAREGGTRGGVEGLIMVALKCLTGGGGKE